MKKHPGRVILVLMGAILLGWMVKVHSRLTPPSYEGILVTDWIKRLSIFSGFYGPFPSPPGISEKSANRYESLSTVIYEASKSRKIYLSEYTSDDAAIFALKAIGTPALPYLVKALRQQDTLLSITYDKLHPYLLRYGGNHFPEPSLPAVRVRRAASNALSHMAAIAKPACPALLEATRDPDQSVRGYAVKALNEISYGDAEVRKTLEGLIRPAMPHAITIQLIAQYHLSSSNAVQALVGILHDGSITNRTEALYLLKEIGPKAQTATPALLKTLKHPDRYLRASSCATLAAMPVRN